MDEELRLKLRLESVKTAQLIERGGTADNVMACAEKLFRWITQPASTAPEPKAKGK